MTLPLTPEQLAEQVFYRLPSFEDYDENKAKVIEIIATALRQVEQETWEEVKQRLRSMPEKTRRMVDRSGVFLIAFDLK